MRSKNAVRNLAAHLGYEILIFILGIIFPRFVIQFYGNDVNGLTSTITRILSLINLIQAGAVGAAIFQMYKPVAENDYETQSAIIYSAKKFYRRITVIYMTVALLAGVFYGFRLRDEQLNFVEIFLSFLILAANGAGSLLFNTICDIYISPHQKKYYLTLALVVDQVVRYGLMTVVLVFRLHFVFIYLSYLAGSISGVLVNLFFYRKLSKGKITRHPKNKNYDIPDRRYLMMSSIGSEAVTASPAVIISTLINLTQVSVFSVYSMVFTSMKTILNSIQLSFSAIFGNLVKTSSDDHIREVHETIELMTILIGTIAATCVGFLLMPFIGLYVKGITDVRYDYLILAIFVVAYTVIFAFRTSFSYVATVYGLFKQTCRITLIFGGIGIVISVLCVLFFGMPYVMCGLLFNQFGCAVTTLWVIKKDIPWFRVKKLLIRAVLMVLMASGGVIAYVTMQPTVDSWLKWVLFGFAGAAASIAVCFVYCLLFERKEFARMTRYALNILKRKRRN